MKKISHLLILAANLLFVQSNFSQSVKYGFSQEFETIKKHQDLGFYQLDKNVYAEVYYKHEKEIIFQIFDEKFNKVKKEETVEIPEMEGYENEGLFKIKNEFFWMYSTWHRSDEKEQLWALHLNKETFKFDKKPIRLSETSKLTRSYGSSKYRFYSSRDSGMVLMACRLKPTERRDKYNRDVLSFNLYDKNLKTIYSHEIEMPYMEADMSILGRDIDSKGNIYLLASVKLNNSLDGETKENKGLSRYELMRVNQKNNTMQAIKIELGDKYFNDAILSEDQLGDIVITGYYSKRSGGGADGAYVMRLEYDEKGGVKKVKTTFCEFPKEVLQAYESEKTRRKMEKRDKEDDLEATNLELRKVVFDADGGLTIIGEEYFVVVHTSTSSNGATSTSYTYYYDNIIVLKADKTGKTQWCQKIPKYQKGKKTDDLGFHHHAYKGTNYFFFLDNAKNAKLPLTERPALHLAGKGGYLMCVKIDEAGKTVKEPIFDIKDEDVKLKPMGFEHIGQKFIVDRLKEDRSSSKIFKLEIL